MSNEALYEGDVAAIHLTLTDRLTGAAIAMPNASITVDVLKPGETAVLTHWTFTPLTDGSDGKFTRTTADSDLDTVGTWRLQPVPTDDVGPFAADPDTFRVKARL